MAEPTAVPLKRDAQRKYERWRLDFHARRVVPLIKRRLLSPRIPRVPAAVLERHRVTAVLGHLNRAGRRLENSLRSLAAQDLPDRCFELCVVDLGSTPEVIEELHRLARLYRVRLILLHQAEAVWSRSYALNVGIRHSDPAADIIATVDADCLYTPNYLRTMIAAHHVLGRALAFSDAYELPEKRPPESIDVAALDWQGIIATLPKFGEGGGATQCFTRRWVERVRGFDERFGGWGMQDLDLWNRARRMGLVTASVVRWAYCLHQWHPISRRLPDPAERQRRLDITYGDFSLVRNPDGWGELPPGAEVLPPPSG